MSLSSTAIMEGTVVRLSSRTVQKKDGSGPITFNSFTLFGDECQGEISINLDVHAAPAKGDVITCRVKISTYRDDDQLELDAYLV